METVLAVERLSVYRGTHQVVHDVSFALEAGTDTALIGPNGAGKSTLVQALLGIIPWQSGDVSLLGRSIRAGKIPVSVRPQIAYLPQSFLFDRGIPMTVAEFVALGWGRPGISLPWRSRIARQRAVVQALTRVNACHLIHQSIGRLSGGETKRVLLAYCLVQPRRLLILDEAPAGLDYQAEAEFYHLLNQLKLNHGWTILQISHDLEMVSRFCDQVICLNRSIVCQGTPDVTLSIENLIAAYGPQFARYRHQH
ncbi:metal ABC transporter ATP-binding protein [Thermocoleostomius sinensis A174]|jgi:zinc/manganese transport system ATP-binding protein|uniref:Metal ABC transporter ATP-binding protein n=2 Tax=Thermocoleostomius TaxID=3065395 RepID=A0A9E9C5J1_9CYAN|nr:metal ABC transporter ATP-binding protein [Thermocoleostomius sinensis A174]